MVTRSRGSGSKRPPVDDHEQKNKSKKKGISQTHSGRLTQTQEDIEQLRDLSVQGVQAVQNLQHSDQQLHTDTVHLFNGTAQEFGDVRAKFSEMDVRMAGMESMLAQIISKLQ